METAPRGGGPAQATWSLQDAKNKFSTVVEAARRDGPQTVTKRGQPAVVVLAAEEYARLQQIDAKPRMSFVEFLLSGPKSDVGIEIDRKEFKLRDVDR